jgi:hypothetical protein
MGKPANRALLIAAAIPGTVALAVTYLYILGAVEIYGQFHNAGLDVQAVMPLVPLEQYVGRGAGEILGIAVLLVLSWLLGYGFFGPDAPDPPGKPITRRFWLVVALATAAGAIFLPMPLFETLATTALVGAVVIFQLRHRDHGLTFIPTAISLAVVLQATVNVATALYQPEPLPIAKIELVRGVDVEAPLIANTGTTWYLVDEKEQDGEADEKSPFIAIPAARVERASVVSRERQEPRSLFELIWP